LPFYAARFFAKNMLKLHRFFDVLFTDQVSMA